MGSRAIQHDQGDHQKVTYSIYIQGFLNQSSVWFRDQSRNFGVQFLNLLKSGPAPFSKAQGCFVSIYLGACKLYACLPQILRQGGQGSPLRRSTGQSTRRSRCRRSRGASIVKSGRSPRRPCRRGHQRIGQGSQLAATCVGTFGQSGLLAKAAGQQPVGAHPLGGNLLQIVHSSSFSKSTSVRQRRSNRAAMRSFSCAKAVAGHALQNLFFRGKNLFVHGAHDARSVGQPVMVIAAG